MRRAINVVVELVAVVMAPIALIACAMTGIDQAALLSIVVAVASLVLFFAGYEKNAPRLRDTMPVVVLAALAAAGRILFAPFPSFKPVSAIAIIAGAAFGRRSGFMVGALAALVSNFFFGQGPWTPWQMYGWGLIGYLGGVLASLGAFDGVRQVFGRIRVEEGERDDAASASRCESGASTSSPEPAAPASCCESAPPASRRREFAKAILGLVPLVAWGFVSGYLYGFVLNIWSIVGFYHPQSIGQALVVYAAALPFDTMHAISTAVFLVVLYGPWMRKLARIRKKYALLGG